MRRGLRVASALAAAALVGASTTAVAAPAGAPPPRTSASVSDPAYDASGTDPNRRSRADVRTVDYVMPLPRNQRTLYIRAQLRRVGIGDPEFGAPDQQVKTVIDGPGGRDYAVTVYNRFKPPRVVSLASGRPRQVEGISGSWSVTPGRNGVIDLQITTSWMRGLERADFTATGLSRRAEDRTRTAPRLNTRYAGRHSPDGADRRGRGTSADPACTTADDGAFRCSFGTL